MLTERLPRRRAVVVLLASLALAVSAFGFAMWSWVVVGAAEEAHRAAEVERAQVEADRDAASLRRDARNDAARKAREAEAEAAAEEQRREQERAHQEFLDHYWADKGFDNIGQGLYFRWLDSSEYECGYYDCAGFAIVAEDGCPGGVYLEAAIMSGGVQVGWTNTSFTAVPPKGSATGAFEMVTASGDSFNLSGASCN